MGYTPSRSLIVTEAQKVNLLEMIKAKRVWPDMTGKTAMWKIRVYGPAKFAKRTGEIAFISGNSAFTKEGKELRMIDMVSDPSKVGGGGMWAVLP